MVIIRNFIIFLFIIVEISFAQVIVHDPKQLSYSHMHHVLEIAQMVEQVVILQEQLKSIEALDDNILNNVQNYVNQMQDIIVDVQDMGNRFAEFEDNFLKLYPDSDKLYDNVQEYKEQYYHWNEKLREDIKTAFKNNDIMPDIEDDLGQLNQLIDSSNNAQGQLQAIQTSNAILAIIVKQLFRLQKIQTNNNNAKLSLLSKDLSIDTANNFKQNNYSLYEKRQMHKIKNSNKERQKMTRLPTLY